MKHRKSSSTGNNFHSVRFHSYTRIQARNLAQTPGTSYARNLFGPLKAPKYVNPDKAKADEIFEGLNKILESDRKITEEGRLVKIDDNEVLAKGETEIVKYLDKWDELILEDRKELGTFIFSA